MCFACSRASIHPFPLPGRVFMFFPSFLRICLFTRVLRKVCLLVLFFGYLFLTSANSPLRCLHAHTIRRSHSHAICQPRAATTTILLEHRLVGARLTSRATRPKIVVKIAQQRIIPRGDRSHGFEAGFGFWLACSFTKIAKQRLAPSQWPPRRLCPVALYLICDQQIHCRKFRND